MKASPRQQRLLLDLQELDTEQLRLSRRITRIPERADLKTLETQISPLRQRCIEAQHTLEDQQSELKRIEDDVKLVVQRQSRTSERLAKSIQAKEAGNLQEEMEALHRRRSALEDGQLEVMERLEHAQNDYDEALQTLSDAEAKAENLRERIHAQEAELQQELARTAEERAGVAAELQGPVLATYERTRERYGIGAARLRGRVSEGSNMELDPADYQAAMNTPADELYFCPVSGAILVRDFEEPAV